MTNLVDLAELSIVEQDLIVAAVDSLDVHSEGHDDLEVRILALVISHSDLNSLV